MSSIQVIAKLLSNVKHVHEYKTVSEKELSEVNNYFEVVSGDQPMRVYIDLDGYLSDDKLYQLNILHKDILHRLKRKLQSYDVSIMSSSSLASNKLSYRITYINKACNNVQFDRLLKRSNSKKFNVI